MIYQLKKQGFYSLAALMLAQLACQPVFAIGWKEVFFVLILVTFLIGPPIYKFIRRIENLRRKK